MKGDFIFYLDEEDLKKLQKTLTGLETIDRERAIEIALGKGMQNMVNVGQITLKRTTLHPGKGTGNLAKSLVYKIDRASKLKKAQGTAGFKRSSRKNKIGGGNHSYLVDRGTKERWQTTTGKYVGSVRAGRPQTGSLFWTKTVSSEGPKALEMLMDGINNAIIEVLERN